MVIAPRPMRETVSGPRCALFMGSVPYLSLSGLGGGHVPQFGDGCPAWPSDHEGDAVGDVLRLEPFGDVLGVRGGEFVLHRLVVVGNQFGGYGTGLEYSDPHVLLRDLLAEGFGEAVHSEFGHVVDAKLRPC